MKYDVFISYSRKDYAEEIINEKGEKEERIIPGNIVSQTIKCLESNEISYWWDKDGIYSADQFIAVIAKAIRESSIFLFISTENSNESYWTPKEISAACHLKKKIIPFKVDDSYYTDSVLLLLSDVDFIDYSKDKKKAFEKLEISINRILEEQNRKEAEDSMLAAVEERLLKEYELKFKAEEERLRKEYELKLKAAEEERRREIETSVKAIGEQPKEEEKKLPEIKLSPNELHVAVKNGKYGYVDEDKKVVIPLVYDSARKFSAEGFAAVKKDGKYGFIDTTGKECVPFIYDDTSSYVDGLARVKRDGKWGYIDKTGREIIPPQYDESWGFTEGLAWVVRNGKFGYIDKTGREVIPFIYDEAWNFSEGCARVKKDGEEFYIDKNGDRLHDESDDHHNEEKNSQEEKKNWKYYLKTKRWVWIIIAPLLFFIGGIVYISIPHYETLTYNPNGLSLVKKTRLSSEKYGYQDTTGKVVIPYIYDYADDFASGLARVKKDGKYGYIDETGKEVIPCIYDDVNDFSEGMARVKKDGKWYYIDTVGEKIGMNRMQNDFVEGLARAVRYDSIHDDKWGYKDEYGNVVIPPIYDRVNDFSEGLASVEKGRKYGYIDKTGKEVIPFIYDSALDFSEGLASVEKDGKWGYIDTTGVEVIPFTYDYAGDFSSGLAPVKKDGKYGFIDKTGKLVIPCEYDNTWSFSEGLVHVEKGGKHGFIDKTGKVVIPCKYKYAYSFSEGLAHVGNSLWQWGYIDKISRSASKV